MGDARYRRVKSSLVEALHRCPVQTKLEEINDLDSILQYPISAVPAILVEDKIIFEQGEAPTSAELETMLLEALAADVE